MTTIEIMLEALKWASATVIPLDCPTIKERITEAIAAGEAELRREPDAWVDTSHSHGWPVFASRQYARDYSVDVSKMTPLYTREEIK